MKKWLIVFFVAVAVVIGTKDKIFSMEQAPKTIQASGKVTEIDLKSLIVKVAQSKGENLVFKINEKTKVVKNDKNTTPLNIKAGDHVTIIYRVRRGKKIALTIVVREQVLVPQKTTPAKNKR